MEALCVHDGMSPVVLMSAKSSGQNGQKWSKVHFCFAGICERFQKTNKKSKSKQAEDDDDEADGVDESEDDYVPADKVWLKNGLLRASS